MESLGINWNQYTQLIKRIAHNIQLFEEANSFYFLDICGIPRGGLVAACCLSYYLDRQLLSKGSIHYRTLIIDDISDSGHTLRNKLNEVEQYLGVCPYSATLIYNKGSSHTPDFYGMKNLTIKWIHFPYELGSSDTISSITQNSKNKKEETEP